MSDPTRVAVRDPNVAPSCFYCEAQLPMDWSGPSPCPNCGRALNAVINPTTTLAEFARMVEVGGLDRIDVMIFKLSPAELEDMALVPDRGHTAFACATVRTNIVDGEPKHERYDMIFTMEVNETTVGDVFVEQPVPGDRDDAYGLPERDHEEE